MAQWIDKDALKDALAQFVVRGDQRWASRGEVVTVEEIREIAKGEVDTQALTEEDLLEVIAIIQG